MTQYIENANMGRHQTTIRIISEYQDMGINVVTSSIQLHFRTIFLGLLTYHFWFLVHCTFGSIIMRMVTVEKQIDDLLRLLLSQSH